MKISSYFQILCRERQRIKADNAGIVSVKILALAGIFAMTVLAVRVQVTKHGTFVHAAMEESSGGIIPLKIEGIMPTKSAPKCATHDETTYHGVWDGEKGCYYDHTHGDDPSKTIFADVVKE